MSMATPNEPHSLVIHRTGLGSTAWRATEPDAPGLFAFIYDASCMAIPLAPETDDLTFAVIDEGTNETLGLIVIAGRAGLNDWYLANVGHLPDKEPDGQVPIMNLIDNVAAHLLLRYFEQGGENT